MPTPGAPGAEQACKDGLCDLWKVPVVLERAQGSTSQSKRGWDDPCAWGQARGPGWGMQQEAGSWLCHLCRASHRHVVCLPALNVNTFPLANHHFYKFIFIENIE